MPVAIKISFPEEGRKSEPDFICRGRELNSGGLQDHLPLVHAWDNLEYTTGKIRKEVKLVGTSQHRRRCIIIYEHLESAALLSRSTDFASAWRDCVIVHRIMWKAGLEHGDIGLGNIMYRRKGKKIKGVLNDWDLATWRGQEKDEVYGGGQQRTGTIPFAALDLIRSPTPRRRYQHDLESMGWTLQYHCLDLDHPINRQLINAWLDVDLTVAIRKAVLLDEADYKIRDGFGDLFEFSRRFLFKLAPYVVGRLSDSRSSPATPSHTRISEREFLNYVPQLSGSSAPKTEDKQAEQDDEKIWSDCMEIMETIFKRADPSEP